MNLVSGVSKLSDTYFHWRLKAPYIFNKARGGCLGHASVILLANEANDHYESFIAPLLLIFLDQIGIENVGFGENWSKPKNKWGWEGVSGDRNRTFVPIAT